MKRGQYVPMDVHLDEDDRILDAGPLAEVLYLRVLRLCGRKWETDGFCSARQVERLVLDLHPLRLAAAVEHPVDALVRVGLLRPDTDDPYRPGYRVRSWLEWNRSAEEITRGREKDAARKRNTRAVGQAKDVREDGGSRPAGLRADGSVASGGVHAPEAEALAESEAAAAAEPAAAALLALPPVDNLRAALAEVKLVVRWDRLTNEQASEVVDLIATHGVPALVRSAQQQHQANSPAAHAAAWLGGWRALERPRPRLVLAPCPTHPYLPPASTCSACAADAKAAGQ